MVQAGGAIGELLGDSVCGFGCRPRSVVCNARYPTSIGSRAVVEEAKVQCESPHCTLCLRSSNNIHSNPASAGAIRRTRFSLSPVSRLRSPPTASGTPAVPFVVAALRRCVRPSHVGFTQRRKDHAEFTERYYGLHQYCLRFIPPIHPSHSFPSLPLSLSATGVLLTPHPPA
jgi:hypothetical protein